MECTLPGRRTGASPSPATDRARLEALAGRAAELSPVPPHERAGVMRGEAALLVDRLLVRVARSRGALDVAIGERLAALALGDRTLRLGFAGIGDYARERLGIAGRTAQDLARLARELASRPLLREAVRRGEVSARKAQTVLPVARGDEEASWVERARVETVRALGAAVREQAAPGADDAADEPWERVALPLAPAARERLDRAMALAGRVLGATAPRWQRLEAICAEYLGAHPMDEGEDEGSPCTAPSAAWLDGARAALEEETRRWTFLDELGPTDPVAAPPSSDATDALQLDAELRALAALRDRWDDVLGHLAMLLRQLGLWRDMRFASFAHYCTERLGMAARTVEQRAALARRLHALPSLRGALREGRVSYEQARLVARAADDSTVAAWIDRAERTTCVALRREVEAAGEAQMCARAELDLRLPRPVARLLATACRAARAAEGRWLSPGECLARLAEHFIATWEGAVVRPRTPEARALARDGGVCQVPGCSRAAAHAHHVTYRSRGGGDQLENLVALCAAHHLVGVHGGYLRVSGQAPGALRWEVSAPAA